MESETRSKSLYDQYYLDVSRTEIPNGASAERTAFREYYATQDSKIREKIIEGGLRFVVKLARQYRPKDNEQLMNLISAGNVGLTIAFDRYCPWVIACPRCTKRTYVKQPKHQRCKKCNRRLRAADARPFTTRFLTYAAWWINAEIREMLYGAPIVHPAIHLQKEYRRNGTPITVRPVELSDYTEEEYLQDNPADVEPINRNAQEQLYRILETALSPRRAFVLAAYYGLRGDQPKTLREISNRLRITPERVRQLKEEAKETLNAVLGRERVHTLDDVYA
ncbi:MAG: hypothetical protein CMK74_00710 [Pseudomonadales bacterium]|nr:hypothetical protein [Pseudomonadales bacterium]|tara:strand:+ start:1453 stop:2289 length:837 start_codon:yes stop_codon:yes gene_type:complete